MNENTSILDKTVEERETLSQERAPMDGQEQTENKKQEDQEVSQN